MKKLTLITSLFTALVILSNTADAQVGTSAPTSSMAVTIAQVRDLAVSSGATTTFDFSSIASLDNGIETTNAVGLTYKANKPWILSVKANSATFTGTSVTPMPVSVVSYKITGGAQSYVPLTATDAVIAGTSGTRGNATVGLDYKVNPGYIYAPANDYGLVITYTLSDQ